MIRLTVALLATAFAVAGCGPHIPTDEEQQNLQKEWAPEKYDEAMRKMGREKELEEGKKRDEAYERGENINGR